MTSGISGNMANEGEHKKYGRKAAELEWVVYDDDTSKTRPDWEYVPYLQFAKTAMQYVGLLHFDRLWPRPSYERHCKFINASYIQLEDVETK